jgi:hypothetical protein
MLVEVWLSHPKDVAGLLQGRQVGGPFAESSTTSKMSTMGLAASPGTEVEPMCSMEGAALPSAARILASSWRNRSGQTGS